MRNYCISVIPYISEFYRLFYSIEIKFNPSLQCVINFFNSEFRIPHSELKKVGDFLPLFKKKSTAERPLPRHIAIVMDGNGRWAKKRGLPRSAGHVSGAKTFKTIARYCNKIGLEYLTVYAFSTENWKRAEDEVSSIMFLLERYLKEIEE